jgi:hypothetical protein
MLLINLVNLINQSHSPLPSPSIDPIYNVKLICSQMISLDYFLGNRKNHIHSTDARTSYEFEGLSAVLLPLIHKIRQMVNTHYID